MPGLDPDDSLQSIFDRITAGTHTDADLATLRRFVRTGQIALATGEQAVAVGGNISDTVIVSGDGNVLTLLCGPNAAAIQAALRAVLEETSWRRYFGVPFQAPPLPAHFVPRPEVTDVLKARLLIGASEKPGVLVVSAIHGLGGIGKSTLAAALCYSPEVQTRFPDGILWATLGQQPEQLSLLGAWIQALGDYQFRPTTVQAASTHLRTLLHDKAMLLVVDDVWDRDHGRPFLVGGPRCRALITTRRADVADEVGADLHELDVMTPEQSLALLVARLGRALEDAEHPEALRLARAVGYLPQALELAAVRVRTGVSWIELRKALKAEIARLEALEGPRRRRHGQTRLEATFNLSLDALRHQDEGIWRAFVWLGVLPEDVSITASMAGTLWTLGTDEAVDLLETLWNDALLMRGGQISIGARQLQTYHVHDLLHDVARRLLSMPVPGGLGMTLPDAHAMLLQRYRARAQMGKWHTLPDDGYIHGHCATHLAKAEQWTELHNLIASGEGDRQLWAEIRHRLQGSYAGYLTDVRLAWQHADDLAGTRGVEQGLGQQLRYAFIESNIHSLASSIPEPLLLALVRHGAWSLGAGLEYARQIPHLTRRIETSSKLLQYLSPVPQSELATEITGWASSLSNAHDRDQALVMLCRNYHEQALYDIALAAATQIQSDSTRADALTMIVSDIVELRDSLDCLDALQTPHDRLSVLNQLFDLVAQRSHLLPNLLHRIRSAAQADDLEEAELIGSGIKLLEADTTSQIIEALDQVPVHPEQLDLLLWMAPHLTRLATPIVLHRVLQLIETIKEPEAQLRVFTTIAGHLPSNLLSYGLNIARSLDAPEERALALACLIPRLSYPEQEVVLQEAIGLICTVPELENQETQRELTQIPSATESRTRTKIEALLSLAEKTAPPNREHLLQVALTTITGFGSDHWMRDQLERLILAWVRHGDFQQAIDCYRRCANMWNRSEICHALLRELPAGQFDLALELTKELPNLPETPSFKMSSPRATGLIVLAEKYTQDASRLAVILDTALTVSPFSDGYTWSPRAEAIIGIVPYLPVGMVNIAVTALENLTEEWLPNRPDGNDNDASELPPPPRFVQPDRLPEIITESLTETLPYLPDEAEKAIVTDRALGYARCIQDAQKRAVALVWVADCLPETARHPVLTEALNAVHAPHSSRDQDNALGLLAEELASLDASHLALGIIQEISEPEFRGRVLGKIAPDLSEPLIPEAFALSLSLPHPPILEFAPHLPLELMDSALDAANALSDSHERERVRGRLAVRLAGLGDPCRALDIIESSTNWPRELYDLENAASDLPQAVPVERIIGVLKDRLGSRMGYAVLSAMIPYAPTPLLREFVSLLRSQHDDDLKVKSLVEIACRFSEGQQEEALQLAVESAQGIHDDMMWEIVLRELPNQLADSGFLDWAVEATRGTNTHDWRTNELIGLIPRLSEDRLRAVLRDIPSGSLLPLIDHLEGGFREEVLQRAVAAAKVPGVDHAKERVLQLRALAEHVAPHERDELLRMAFETVAQMEPSSDQAQLIIGLLQMLPEELRQEAAEIGLVTAHQIDYHHKRIDVIKGLWPFLPSRLQKTALYEAHEAARQIDNAISRAPQLLELAFLAEGSLKAKLIDEATDAFQYGWRGFRPGWDPEEFRIIAAKLRRLGVPERIPVCLIGVAHNVYSPAAVAPLLAELGYPEEAISLAMVDDDEQLCEVWPLLAPQLPRRIRVQALYATTKIKQDWDRIKTLNAMLPAFTDEPEILSAIGELPTASDRGELLAELSPTLRKPLFDRALQMIREISSDSVRASALAKVARNLNGPLQRELSTEAFALIGQVHDSSFGSTDLQTELLRTLIPILPEALLVEVLKESGFLAKDDQRKTVLKDLAVRLLDIERDYLQSLLATMLHILADQPRHKLLGDLMVLKDVLIKLGGKQAISEIALSYREVLRWFSGGGVHANI